MVKRELCHHCLSVISLSLKVPQEQHVSVVLVVHIYGYCGLLTAEWK